MSYEFFPSDHIQDNADMLWEKRGDLVLRAQTLHGYSLSAFTIKETNLLCDNSHCKNQADHVLFLRTHSTTHGYKYCRQHAIEYAQSQEVKVPFR